jgi:uncharacterized protein (UPF0332 family)
LKPETARYLEKARKLLSEARAVVPLRLADIAGRTAYLAAFHAAQGLIFERRGSSPKTHRGVHSQFAALVKDDARFDISFRSFLSNSYGLKSIADYETGPEAEVPLAEAERAIALAAQFIALVERLIPPLTQ